MRQRTISDGECQRTLSHLRLESQRLLPLAEQPTESSAGSECRALGGNPHRLETASTDVWFSKYYRRFAQAGMAVWRESRCTIDAFARDSRQNQATLSSHHRQQQDGLRCAEFGPTTLCCPTSQSTLVLGYYLCLDARRLAVSGDDPRCVQPSNRWLRARYTSECRLGQRSAQTGFAHSHGQLRNGLPLRPGQSVCQPGSSHPTDQPRIASEYEFDGKLLRQRYSRIFLSHAQDRIDLS